MESPQKQPISEEELVDPVRIPEDAFVIVDGIKVIPLTQSLIRIGRRLENNLVLDDPRVSRTHAELRAINGRYVLFDLNSTGGTYVNGLKVTQSVVYPGDVISLAGVNLVYGQKNPPPRPDLKETSPLGD
ncbi:MAG TPA: FHA domain-containing protein [Anaerolineales bacterium]|nr:FHA domain-containing protein [Anaerolineales bacterium]